MRYMRIGLAFVIGACVGCEQAPRKVSVAPINPDREARIPLAQSDHDSRCGTSTRSIVYAGKEPPELQVWGGELPQRAGGVAYNEKIAKQLGYQLLAVIYGTDDVEGSLPLQAKLHRGVWYVQGYLPEGASGGTIYIQICQSNGKVLNYYGTQ